MKRNEFLKHLNQNNCTLYREGGKHSVYINNANNKRITVPRHNELHNDFCKEMCKQLGINIIGKKG
jgi:predicted RNA binding protein YcfA (HicA-like mRNA interferase family)